jgi:hypothetical protein
MANRASDAARGTLEAIAEKAGERLGEERARAILERAAALDAKRSSEIELDHLREAAAAAGISGEAFEQALREQSGGDSVSAVPARRGTAVARYSDLLRDLLGEETEVVVKDDRIEGRTADGVTVSIDPNGHAAASIVLRSSLARKLLAIAGPASLPGLLGFLLAIEEGDPGIGMMLGVFLTVVAAGAGTAFSHLREKKKEQRTAERLRRQLQRLLDKAPWRG